MVSKCRKLLSPYQRIENPRVGGSIPPPGTTKTQLNQFLANDLRSREAAQVGVGIIWVALHGAMEIAAVWSFQ